MKNHSEHVSPLEMSQAAYDGTSTVCPLEVSQNAFLRHLFEETVPEALSSEEVVEG